VPKGPLKKKFDPLLEVSSFFLLVKYEYLNQAGKSRSKHSVVNAMCASQAERILMSYTNKEMNARLGLQKGRQVSDHFPAFQIRSSTFGCEGRNSKR
jgi:hypothetical protein